MIQKPESAWYYPQIELGFNSCMTDILAAVGLSQLQQLDEFMVRRHAITRRYDGV